MMEIKILLPVIIILVVLISALRKSKKETARTASHRSPLPRIFDMELPGRGADLVPPPIVKEIKPRMVTMRDAPIVKAINRLTGDMPVVPRIVPDTPGKKHAKHSMPPQPIAGKTITGISPEQEGAHSIPISDIKIDDGYGRHESVPDSAEKWRAAIIAHEILKRKF